jgi:hypothetical protein
MDAVLEKTTVMRAWDENSAPQTAFQAPDSIPVSKNTSFGWIDAVLANTTGKIAGQESPVPKTASQPQSTTPLIRTSLAPTITTMSLPFRPRPAAKRSCSADRVYIKHPPNEFRAGYTKTYKSKSEALGDLYHNQTQYSDYCPFDPATRTLYPQPRDWSPDELALIMHQPIEDLENIWLPMEFSRASPPSDDQCKATEINSNASTDYFFNLGTAPTSSDWINKTLASSTLPACESQHSKLTTDRGQMVQSSGSRNTATSALLEKALKGINNRGVHSEASSVWKKSRTASGCEAKYAELLEFEDQLSDLEDINAYDSDEIAIESASAKLQPNISLASTESLQSLFHGGLIRESGKALWATLADASPEKAKRVKTWAELGRDFMEKYAPINEFAIDRMLNDTADKVTKNASLTYASEDGKAAVPLVSTHLPRGQFLSAHLRWSRDRDSNDEITFERIEDIAAYESAREVAKKERLEATVPSPLPENDLDSITVEHIEDIAKYVPTRKWTRDERINDILSLCLQEGDPEARILETVDADVEGKGGEMDYPTGSVSHSWTGEEPRMDGSLNDSRAYDLAYGKQPEETPQILNPVPAVVKSAPKQTIRSREDGLDDKKDTEESEYTDALLYG